MGGMWIEIKEDIFDKKLNDVDNDLLYDSLYD